MGYSIEIAPMGRVVVILGAGFSKALSHFMPLTNELGDMVIERLDEEFRRELNVPQFVKENLSFEEWLGWLAEKQPYETESEFWRRFSYFLELQGHLAEVISERQHLAIDDGLSDWLEKLLLVLHQGHATVITLNYDTLVEHGFESSDLRDDNGDKTQITDTMKIFPVSSGRTYGDPLGVPRAITTIDYFKLHGSTDWFWVAGDKTGSTLVRVEATQNISLAQKKAVEGARAGKERFVVPPTSGKSDYFDNPKSRYMWRECYDALQNAELVVLVGYSLPLNDTSLVSMLSRAERKSKAKYLIVNVDSRQVERKLTQLGIPESRIDSIDGSNCVENWVQKFITESTSWIARKFELLLESEDESLLAVGWNQHKIAGITDASFDPLSGNLLLKTGVIESYATLPRSNSNSADSTRSRVLNISDLKSKISNEHTINCIEVEIEDFGTWKIGGFLRNASGIDVYDPSTGIPNWVLLWPIECVS